MDAIAETLRDHAFDEVMISTHSRSISRWLHLDLTNRVAQIGLPVTTVMSANRLERSVVGGDASLA